MKKFEIETELGAFYTEALSLRDAQVYASTRFGVYLLSVKEIPTEHSLGFNRHLLQPFSSDRQT